MTDTTIPSAMDRLDALLRQQETERSDLVAWLLAEERQKAAEIVDDLRPDAGSALVEAVEGVERQLRADHRVGRLLGRVVTELPSRMPTGPGCCGRASRHGTHCTRCTRSAVTQYKAGGRRRCAACRPFPLIGHAVRRIGVVSRAENGRCAVGPGVAITAAQVAAGCCTRTIGMVGLAPTPFRP